MYQHGSNGQVIEDKFGTLTEMNAYPTTYLGTGSTWYIIDASTPPNVTDIYKWSGSAWCKL